jgi:acyl dehydratase
MPLAHRRRDRLRNDPRGMRYFEDFREGEVIELGSHRLTQDEIIDFARQWDPQPFHVGDVEWPYGGLIASGWHTLMIGIRLAVEVVMNHAHGMGASRVEGIEWLKPVRPGDELTYRLRVLDARPSERSTERGTVRLACEASDAAGEPVARVVVPMLFRRRPPAGG